MKDLLNKLDDKAGIIAAVTLICIVAMWKDMPQANELVNYVIVGMFGMATGRMGK